MKSATSYFNKTVLRKDLTRFWPVWGLSTIFFLLIVALGNPIDAKDVARSVVSSLPAMMVFNLLYGWVCALLLLGDLFKSRLCNGLHTMPIRREGYLLTHIAAGLLFFLIPNLTLCIVISFLLKSYYAYALLLFAASLLQFLCFFGIAVFSVMCSGKALGMSAVFWIILLFPSLVYWFCTTFYEPMLPGVLLESADFLFFSPITNTGETGMMRFAAHLPRKLPIVPRISFSHWRYLICAAAAGVVFLGISFLLYRRRKLECAGDLIALRPAKPIFLVIYTLSAGALLHSMASISDSFTLPFLCIGLLIGYFTGRMLLERSLRVFGKRSLLGAAAFAGVLIVSMLIVRLDPIGITKYVPEPEQIQSVSIGNWVSASRYYMEEYAIHLQEKADIERITKLHKSLISLDTEGIDSVPIQISYATSDGRTIRRYYQIPVNSETFLESRSIFSRPEVVLGCANQRQLFSCLKYGAVSLNGKELSEEVALELLSAMYQDCLEGKMAQHPLYHTAGSEHTVFFCTDVFHASLVAVYSDAANTLRVIEKYGFIAPKNGFPTAEILFQ